MKKIGFWRWLLNLSIKACKMLRINIREPIIEMIIAVLCMAICIFLTSDHLIFIVGIGIGLLIMLHGLYRIEMEVYK